MKVVLHRLSLFLCLSLAVLVPQQAVRAASSTWTAGPSLSGSRSDTAAALLPDGRVLFTGGTGSSGPLTTTEIFNTDGSFSAGASMHDARASHTAVTLKDGRVLVAGGTTAGGAVTASAEVYDPGANTWTLVGSGMSIARSGHTASLLNDGRVLIAGGQTANGATNTLEIFHRAATALPWSRPQPWRHRPHGSQRPFSPTAGF
jgi:N-acetylneuraminic acid mutarotase